MNEMFELICTTPMKMNLEVLINDGWTELNHMNGWVLLKKDDLRRIYDPVRELCWVYYKVKNERTYES